MRHINPAGFGTSPEVIAMYQQLIHPRNDEGVFYADYQLPNYDTEIDTTYCKSMGTETHTGWDEAGKRRTLGTTHLEEWRMSDGTRYDILIGRTAQPTTFVPIIKDTAWGTQVHGLNTDVGRKFLSLGYDFLIKGPEKGSSITLSHSAHNTHKVLDRAEDRGIFNTARIALEGYSRGSMIGFGTNAYAAQNNREVIYSNFTDPCIAQPFGPNFETLTKLPVMPIELAAFGLQIALSQFNPKRTAKLAATADLSRAGILQLARTGIPLFNGEAGALASQTPDTMKATVAFFGQSVANDQRIFTEILKDRPGVRTVMPDGGHLRGIDDKIINHSIAPRFGRLALQLMEGRLDNELNYDFIHLGKNRELRDHTAHQAA